MSDSYANNGGDLIVGSLKVGAPASVCAAIEVLSSTQGLLLPRLTTVQRNAISSPLAGLFIYNTTNSDIEFYNGSIWQTFNLQYAWNHGNVLDVFNLGLQIYGSTQSTGDILLLQGLTTTTGTIVHCQDVSTTSNTRTNILVEQVGVGATGRTSFRAITLGVGKAFVVQNVAGDALTIDGNGNLSFGGAADPSALITLNSTSQGFLGARMPQAQRNAIASPAQGLQLFNTDTNYLNYFDGLNWQQISPFIPYTYVATGVSQSPNASNNFTFYSAGTAGINFAFANPNTLAAGWNIKVKNTSTGTITLSFGTYLADGVATITLYPNEVAEVVGDGTAFYNVNFVYRTQGITVRDYPATSIVDGVTFVRTTINTFVTVLDCGATDSIFLQPSIPFNYIPSSNIDVLITYAPKTVGVGSYTWTISYQYLPTGTIITAAPSTVTGTQASSAIANQSQTIDITIPGSTFSANEKLLLKIGPTTLPVTGDHAYIMNVQVKFPVYVNVVM